jgi:carbon monoxide dehydrogenase subunit G
MHVERRFTVPQPPEAVFDYLADFTHTNDWDPGTVETRRTSGDGGVGSTYANTSEFLGRKVDLIYETLELQRPGRIRFRGQNDSVTSVDTIDLVAHAGGTELTYDVEMSFHGLLMKVFGPLAAKPGMERLATRTQDQMQRCLSSLA